MRRAALLLALTLAFEAPTATIGVQVLSAQQTVDARVADLARAGKVRTGVGVVAPHWAVKDAATGELRGVAIDLGRAFAARLGVECVPVAYPSPPSILEGLKTEAWD